MGNQFLPMKHEQQLVTSTTYYKSFRVLFLRGISCYHIMGAHLGTTNVSVSRPGFFHGPGWWHPSPPCWGSWVCHGSWLDIKKRKKMSGGLYNSTIKKLCPQSRCGREGQMWAVLLCVNMRNNCSEPKPRADDGLTWREQVPWRGFSATHRGEHSLTNGQPGGRKLEFLTSYQLPRRKTESPSSNFCLDSRVPSGASKDPLRRLLVCSQVCI